MTPQKKDQQPDAPAPLSVFRRTLLITALCLAVLCQAIDNTIISTAIPRITDEFNSLDDVAWYGSGYLVACCALQLTFGKLYNLFRTKWVFLASLGLFEVGSVVCGATPTSIGLIMGRVIAGAGSGGIYSGAILAIAAVTPLQKRSLYNGSLAAVYAVASIAGPLLGGAFTDRVTWRLCFYINLPFGAVAAVCVLLFLPARTDHKPDFDLPLREKFSQFDWLGLFLFIPFIVCLLLALQWGGSTYAWSNGRIIALFVLSGVLLFAFIGVQLWKKDGAMVPPSVARQRTVWSCSLYTFAHFGSYMVISYFLPIWFQAIKEVSAVQSGIDLLPLILGTLIMAIVSGGLVSLVGYYSWSCITASLLGTAGAALLTQLSPATPSSRWIGYQILYGAGTGFGIQQPLVAVQTALPERQIAEGTAILVFMQNFGGAVVLLAAQTIFDNTLVAGVRNLGIPVDPTTLLAEGTTRVGSLVPHQYLPALEEAYNSAIVQTFYISVATAALSFFGSAFIPWLTVKQHRQQAAELEVEMKGDDTASKNSHENN